MYCSVTFFWMVTLKDFIHTLNIYVYIVEPPLHIAIMKKAFLINFHLNYCKTSMQFFWKVTQSKTCQRLKSKLMLLMESRDGEVVRALAVHQYRPNMDWVQLPALTPYVSWVCCRFSSLTYVSFAIPSKNQHSQFQFNLLGLPWSWLGRVC